MTTAANGEQAVSKATSANFDVIILDLAMPKLDGISVIRALRANQSTANVPIFALSAFADEKSRAVVVAAGGDLALDKPCLPVDLEVVVGVLVARGKRIRSSA